MKFGLFFLFSILFTFFIDPDSRIFVLGWKTIIVICFWARSPWCCHPFGWSRSRSYSCWSGLNCSTFFIFLSRFNKITDWQEHNLMFLLLKHAKSYPKGSKMRNRFVSFPQEIVHFQWRRDDILHLILNIPKSFNLLITHSTVWRAL